MHWSEDLDQQGVSTGAKAAQRFITLQGYAEDEAKRAGLDITFTTVLPRFAPLIGVGLQKLADVANTAVFLASDHAAAMTGTIVNLTGGMKVD